MRVYSIRNWIFLLHRITGTVLLVYFVAHVLAVSTALIASPAAYASIMGAFRQPIFRAVEVAIVGCIAFHGLNGLHMIAAERGWLRPGGLQFAKVSVAATLCVWGIAAVMAVAAVMP